MLDQGVVGLNESVAYGLGEGDEFTLVLSVEALAFGGFDGYGREVVGREVVGACAHVDDTCFAREFESIGNEAACDEGVEFVGPFVEVHIGVNAPRLFHGLHVLRGGLEFVARSSRLCEEPKRVVVGTYNGVGFDNFGDAFV